MFYLTQEAIISQCKNCQFGYLYIYTLTIRSDNTNRTSFTTFHQQDFILLVYIELDKVA